MAENSPMMQQYLSIKNNYKDSILFFRLGDFYEMFFDDAKLVSQELDLTLTGKDYGQKERAPMCGIPYHSCEAYIARLVSKGYKVAMCDQVENSTVAKGIVKREVVRVITPGTVMEDSMLDESKNNYICSINISKKRGAIGVSFCDVSTGELKITEIKDNFKNALSSLKNELGKFLPKEILFSGDIILFESLKDFIKEKLCSRCEILENELSENDARQIIINHFKVDDLSELGADGKETAVSSAGNLFEYLKITQKNGLERITTLQVYNKSEYMGIDLNSVRNLEIVETMRTKSKKGSLLWVLDKTKTAMGKRMLRSWIERPLLNIGKIKNRQDAVEELVDNTILRDELGTALMGVHDMERLMTRVTYGSANARDLKSLSAAVSKLPEIKFILYKFSSALMKSMCDDLDLLKDVFMLIENAIVDNPPFLIKEGGIIKSGYSSAVDALRNDMKGGKTIVGEIERRERQNTGIPKLKVGYNKVFGYFIEVPNSFKDKVPEEYIRKQTLTNCERYITEELKGLEARILYARDKINETEYKIFETVRKKVAESLPQIIKSANIIAQADTLRSLAETAAVGGYVKPEIDYGKTMSIKDGRHPVVESLLKGSPFVPNDTLLDDSKNMISIITGPNMAGKSTYMRQNALIVLMAQIGSFVPASKAKIGIVDNIFTRIGASDDLASGQSTFMIEMNEVSDILKNATPNSLIILDEIGRGTSTFDGMSIAKAVLEYVANTKTLGAKTLFATHYHELTEIENELPNVKNYSVAVKKREDDIVFLRKIVPGAADESYGIEVAKLAGLPSSITKRAKEILKDLESGNIKKSSSFHSNITTLEQIGFDSSYVNNNKIIQKLQSLDTNVLTPIESMNILYNLVDLAKNAQ